MCSFLAILVTMIVEMLKNSVGGALKKLSLPESDVHLEHPADLAYGDYSTNAAMVGARQAQQNPKELAEKIVRVIARNKPDEVEKIEIGGSGFINFSLSRDFFANSIQEILDKDKEWGKNIVLKGRKVMIEYTDPNPFKEMHIGHVMDNAVGESIARIIECSGAEVKRANYQGDVGVHVAKAVYGIQKLGGKVTDIKMLGKAYVFGADAYEKNEKEKSAIDVLNRKIYEHSDKEVNDIYDKGRSLSLAHFEIMYKKLDTHFDYYFFESQSGVFGKEVVEKGLKNKVFEQSEGAVVFRGEKYGLHTRVFLNSEGLPTYEAKELGLARLKYDTYPYDISFVITASEIEGYFKVVLKAMEFVFPELAKKTIHVSHGMLRLKTGKMSSRTGDVVTAEFLIDEVEKKVEEVMKDRDLENADEISLQVAIGAIKYFVLKQAASKDIVFDFEKALSFEGDSGPYLQYAATRAHSILEKARERNIKESTHSRPKNVTTIERLLYRFPEIVKRAQREYEPHYVTTYLTELAGAFNSYYAQERIVDAGECAPYKIALTKAFYTTMKNGLWLLGIKAPEHM